jgi:hypothetical protein
MKLLTIFAVGAAAALALAGGTWAKATYEPYPGTTFISRGELIANGVALLPQGEAWVGMGFTFTATVSCPMVGGATVEVTTPGWGGLKYGPDVRTSANGMITGYFIGPDTAAPEGSFHPDLSLAGEYCPAGRDFTRPVGLGYGPMTLNSLVVNNVSIPFKTR